MSTLTKLAPSATDMLGLELPYSEGEDTEGQVAPSVWRQALDETPFTEADSWAGEAEDLHEPPVRRAYADEESEAFAYDIPRADEASAPTDAAAFAAGPALRRGARGAGVATLQQLLTRVGLAVTADGVFGPGVERAVRSFQARAGLTADGVAGRQTKLALVAAAGGAPLPAPGPAPGPAPVPAQPGSGRLVIQQHPMLRAHRGTAPDLILRWSGIVNPGDIDVVVHFHGYSGRGARMRIDNDKESISGLDFVDPDNPTTLGRTRPTLGLLPRGNHFGGSTGAGYNFPALVGAGALQRLIDDALAQLSTATGLSLRMGRLILTGHSGGGAPIMAVLAHMDPDEVHVFDGTYGSAANLARWAKARIARQLAGPSSLGPAMRVLYIPGSPTQAQALKAANEVCAVLAGPDAAGLRPSFRVDATRVQHNDIPRRFGWRLLADPAASLPDATSFVCRGAAEAEQAWEAQEDEGEWGEAFDTETPQAYEDEGDHEGWNQASEDEDMAWLDFEAEAESESEDFGAQAFEPEDHEAEAEDLAFESEDEDEGYEGEGFEEGRFEANRDETFDAYEAEEANVAGLAALEALLESEAGAGTSLADLLKGVAALALGPNLRRGNKGPAVATLQRCLAKLGADLAVDGTFGPNTLRAVKAFQARSGLTPDGIVGRATKTALAAALRGASPSPPPTPPPSPPSVGPLDQATVDRLAAITFGNAADIAAFFARAGGFQAWFNAELGGRTPFVRTKGAPLKMPTTADARAHFDRFWDNLAFAYGQPRISALEFAGLVSIVLNETDGHFSNRTERGGGAKSAHPGIAYFFDKIDGHKVSYQGRNGSRRAGDLFNDPVFIAAHGTLGGAAQLANHGHEFGGVWNGERYPVGQFPTTETGPEAAFIREADFCKFRGRGVIQTTFRESYMRYVRWVRSYAGSDPAILALKARWAPLKTDDEAATVSRNADWEQVFANDEALARGLAFHAGQGAADYRQMSRDAAVLLDVPADLRLGRRGSIYMMGKRISGSSAYGRGAFRNRTLAFMAAIARFTGAAPTPPAPTPPTPTPPTPTPPTPTPPAPPGPAPQGRDTPVPPPDAQTARSQWDGHPRAHGWFEGGFTQYLQMAPLYAKRGVADSAAYLDANIVPLSFFGRRQPGHRDLVARLALVEQQFAGSAPTPPVRSFGCLNVRPIRGTTQRLSNHALGRAFDLDPGSNPRITSAIDFKVIEAVTGAKLSAIRDPSELSRLSQLFQRTFNDGWVSQQTQPDVVKACHNHEVRKRLDGYARAGFYTLSVPLTQALIAAGFSWGGAWKSSKDFMHFELPKSF